MSLQKILFAASAFALSLTAGAQSLNTNLQTTNTFKANRYEKNISRFDMLKQTDKQIKEIGEHNSANGLPSKASAQKMLKNAMKANPSFRRKALAKPQNKAKYTANDTIFFDSFEGWDGKTLPWLPTSPNNWSTKSNIDNITPYISAGMCPTWTLYEGDGYYVPYATDKYQFLVCMFADEVMGADGVTPIAPAPKQDEWLVSPTINNISGTNYLSFDINYSAWHTHFFIEGKDTIYDPKRVAYDVEVLVTTNTRTASYDPEKYTSVYKLSTEVDKELVNVDMNNEDEVAKLLYMKWRHVQIPLKDFEGNNIRIALRYTGTKGGNVLIDALRVSDLLPVALFDKPEGSFYFGHSDQAILLTTKVALMPAYRESVWTNYSNADVLSNEWRYNVNGTSGTSNDYDLLMPASAPTALVEWPTLQVDAGRRSDVYKGGENTYVKNGGDASVYLNETIGTVNFNVGNFDPTKLTWFGPVGSDGSAFGTGGGAFWSSVSDGAYNNVNGIANVFDAPTSPYVFNHVAQAFDDFFDLGATLACTVYKATDLGNGQLRIEDEVIAQTTSFEDVAINSGGHMVIFNFTDVLEINSPIAISIDGLDDMNLISAKPLAQALNHDSEKGYGFVLLRTAKGGITWVEIANAMKQNDGAGNMAMSFCMGMNASFPYIHSNDGDVFAVADNGGTKAFDIETYWNPNGAGEGAVNPKWNVTCSDSWFKAETKVNEADHKVSVNVTADALPNGVEGRAGTVKITALGCSETITIVQGNAITAIESLNANSGIAEGAYTLSGQRINSADAKNGIFIVKKNGKFIKVIK